MIKVVRKYDEDDEHLFKRFKKAVEKAGLIAELKRRAYFDKAADRKKRERKFVAE
jgi:ribosomal protein S21